ncbi:MAG TPA: lipopolysaccharide biosynthesis protein, partial [Gammaproteobacteria bacterium]|nr:lipopolysaccharide biosynthesis protein [Gammaproteobacteria bacterium]
RIFPKTLLMLLISIPISLIAGLLMIYISYLMDQRIHDADNFEERFDIPLWGVLPSLENPNELTPSFNAGLYRIFNMMSEKIKNDGLTIAFVSTHKGAGLSFVITKLKALIEDEGFSVALNSANPVTAGQVVLLDAGGLLENKTALLTLRKAECIVLVAQACRTTVPMLNNSISILNTAFGKVDGIILNRRRFEVPRKLLNKLERWQSSE